MNTRLASIADKRTVWSWFQDQYFQMTLPREHFEWDYQDYSSWFEAMLQQQRLLVGVDSNLRIGLVLLEPTESDIYQMYLFLKPMFWSSHGVALASSAAEFVSTYFSAVSRIKLEGRTRLKNRLIDQGFVDCGESAVIFRDVQ